MLSSVVDDSDAPMLAMAERRHRRRRRLCTNAITCASVTSLLILRAHWLVTGPTHTKLKKHTMLVGAIIMDIDVSGSGRLDSKVEFGVRPSRG